MGQKHVIRQLLCLLVLVKIGIFESIEDGSQECPYEEKGDGDPHPLINLGKSLKHRLTTISCPHGMLLYKDLQSYYNKLSDIYRLLKDRDVKDIVKGFKVYDEINKEGGPPHLNVTMNYFGLKKKYNWQDSGEVKDVKEVSTALLCSRHQLYCT